MIGVVIVIDVIKNIMISANIITVGFESKKRAKSVLELVEVLDPNEPMLVSTKIIMNWGI